MTSREARNGENAGQATEGERARDSTVARSSTEGERARHSSVARSSAEGERARDSNVARSSSAQRSDVDARALLATCVAATVRAADVIRLGSEALAQVHWEVKGPADFVTEVDRNAERAIQLIVSERHPEAVLLAEEMSPKVETAELTFVADPLDGTTNFLHGFPWYAVSIAALSKGAQVAAAVLNVANGELFTAVRGSGARKNGQPIHVSAIEDPSRALLGTGFPFKHREGIAPYMSVLPRLMERTAGLRRAGSAALDLCDIACGRFDAFWELRLAPWDVAAGILLIREAGGVVTDLQGRHAPVAHGPIVAGNPRMHAWLLAELQRRT